MRNRVQGQVNHQEACLWFPAIRAGVFFVAFLLILVVVSQSGCAKKSKPAVAGGAASPIQIAFLPFNVPAGKSDIAWAAMAAPIAMERVSRQSKDVEIIPFWQSMPAAIEMAGKSRIFTPDAAATVASWVTAKWTVLGEFTPTKNGVSMVVDFIPSRSALVPFRYVKSGNLDSIGSGFSQAFEQFLRYMVASPLEPEKGKQPGLTSFRSLAEALDREYGWSVDSQPGKAQEIVSGLARNDEHLARFLFSPTLYPILASSK
jgi:hypothetical protein